MRDETLKVAGELGLTGITIFTILTIHIGFTTITTFPPVLVVLNYLRVVLVKPNPAQEHCERHNVYSNTRESTWKI